MIVSEPSAIEAARPGYQPPGKNMSREKEG